MFSKMALEILCGLRLLGVLKAFLGGGVMKRKPLKPLSSQILGIQHFFGNLRAIKLQDKAQHDFPTKGGSKGYLLVRQGKSVKIYAAKFVNF